MAPEGEDVDDKEEVRIFLGKEIQIYYKNYYIIIQLINIEMYYVKYRFGYIIMIETSLKADASLEGNQCTCTCTNSYLVCLALH